MTRANVTSSSPGPHRQIFESTSPLAFLRAAQRLLGYAYLLLILAFSVGLPVLFILGLFTGATAVFIQLVLKLGIPLFALAAVLVRSLWVRIPAPVELSLGKDQAPALFETALRLARDVRAPQVHQVILDGELRRRERPLDSTPRRTRLVAEYLTVGLPLLDALTSEQFEAVPGTRARSPRSGSRPLPSVDLPASHELDAAAREPQDARTSARAYIFARSCNWYGPPLRRLHARAGALAGILR